MSTQNRCFGLRMDTTDVPLPVNPDYQTLKAPISISQEGGGGWRLAAEKRGRGVEGVERGWHLFTAAA